MSAALTQRGGESRRAYTKRQDYNQRRRESRRIAAERQAEQKSVIQKSVITLKVDAVDASSTADALRGLYGKEASFGIDQRGQAKPKNGLLEQNNESERLTDRIGKSLAELEQLLGPVLSDEDENLVHGYAGDNPRCELSRQVSTNNVKLSQIQDRLNRIMSRVSL